MPTPIRTVSRALFQDIFDTGRKIHGRFLWGAFKPSEDAFHHFSFVVSKKVAQKAIARNTLKRRGRNALTSLLRGVETPYAGIFFFKKGADKLSYDDIAQEITTLLKDAGIR